MSKSWHKRQKIVCTMFLLLAICSCFFLIITTSSADSDYVSTEEAVEISSTGLEELLNSVYSINVNSNGTISSRIGEIYNKPIVSSVSDIFKAIGCIIVAIIIAIKGIQEVMRGDPTEETYLRMFIFSLLSIFMIIYLDKILSAASNLGLGMIATIRSDISSSYINDGSAFEDMSWFIEKMAKLCMWACKFAIVIPAWQNFFEIIIRRMLMPIALSDTVAEGLHSPGIRYLKNYIAVYLKVAVAYLIVDLMGVFLDSLSTADSGIFQFMSMIGIIFGGVGLMTKSQSLVKEILGG